MKIEVKELESDYPIRNFKNVFFYFDEDNFCVVEVRCGHDNFLTEFREKLENKGLNLTEKNIELAYNKIKEAKENYKQRYGY